MFGFLKKLFGATQKPEVAAPYKIETPAKVEEIPVAVEAAPVAVEAAKPTKARRARKPRATKSIKK